MRSTAFALPVLVVPLLVAIGTAPAQAVGCTVRGTPGDDMLVGTSGPDVICGFGGHDVLRGRGGDDALYGGAGADYLIGGSGADRLFGSSGIDNLVPGRGDDQVDGGADRDTVSYRDLDGGVVVDLAHGTATGSVAGTDSLTSIQWIVGSRGDDILKGRHAKERIDALAGDDLVIATSGRDVVLGGEGIDLLDYSRLRHLVVVSLDDGYPHDRYREGSLSGFENLIGTRYPDRIAGDAGPNVLIGGGGGDSLYGGDGDDTLIGRRGPDFFFPGSGDDSMTGGPDVDGFVSAFEGPPIVVDLDAGLVTGGEGGTDQVSSIERVDGTEGDDVIHGGLGVKAVTFYGGGGADDLSTVDGYGGDLIIAGQTSTCAGDRHDTLACEF